SPTPPSVRRSRASLRASTCGPFRSREDSVSTPSTVAIVGAGLIGRAWATIFARAAWQVRLTDPDATALAAAPGLVRDELQMLAGHGLADDPAGAATRVSTASLADALHGADYVQECGPETVDTKRAIFAELDRLASKDTVLAS